MRIIYNAFNSKNGQQHIIGNIYTIMNTGKSFNDIEFSYELRNGFIFIDHFIEEGKHKSYLYKYCYFEHDSIYGEELQEKPIMLPEYIIKDNFDKIKENEEIKYLMNDDILYLSFSIPFGQTQTIDELVKLTYEKAYNKIIEYIRDNELIRQKITDIYLNESRIYFIYEKFYNYSDNDEESSYTIKLLGYTTNKKLADEIYTNGYISGRNIIVTDEMLKLQNVIIKKPEYVYVEVYYEEDKIEDIVGLKKSAYFNFKFIQANRKCENLIPDDLRNPDPVKVQYEKNEAHFYFRYKVSENYIDKKEFTQKIQDLAIHYILFRSNYEK